MGEFRRLEKGEIVREGDQIDTCRDGWRDPARWEFVTETSIGKEAPDPSYPSHSQFRRRIIN